MLDALVVSGQMLSSIFLLYGGLLSLPEFVRAEHPGFPCSSPRRFARGARSWVDFGPGF